MSRMKNSEEEKRERERIKVIFLRRKRRISSNEFIYYVDYSQCLSYKKFVRKRKRERERDRWS